MDARVGVKPVRWLSGVATAALLFTARTASGDPKGAPPPEEAAPGSDRSRAADLFARASEAYRTGQFALAISLLLELHRIKPEPVLHYDLARAYEGLGRWHEAISSYEAYLREDATIADRGAIERRLETLRGLEAAAAAPPTASASAPPPGRSVVPPVIVGALGLVTIGTGLALGVASRNEESKVDDGRDQRAANEALDRAERLATVANVSYVVGGALLVAGAVWLFFSRSTRAVAVDSVIRF
jgi:tetratricopeptide (TPR) repeat protein